MPKVGDKHFAYTEKGKAKAKAAAKKSGKKVEYKSGGKVSKKKSGAKTITARGSGAARPQKFHVTIGG
tara:strand:- start:802 stop:1005 length:204 start_codon:yes stop_codon:yes gene_type:complete